MTFKSILECETTSPAVVNIENHTSMDNKEALKKRLIQEALQGKKHCRSCMLIKPLSAFRPCRSSKDGYQHQCEDCRKEGRRLAAAHRGGCNKFSGSPKEIKLKTKFWNMYQLDPEKNQKQFSEVVAYWSRNFN